MHAYIMINLSGLIHNRFWWKKHHTTFNDFLKVKINETIAVISIPFHNITIKRHTVIEKIGSFILV